MNELNFFITAMDEEHREGLALEIRQFMSLYNFLAITKEAICTMKPVDPKKYSDLEDIEDIKNRLKDLHDEWKFFQKKDQSISIEPNRETNKPSFRRILKK